VVTEQRKEFSRLEEFALFQRIDIFIVKIEPCERDL
jgi:hypothetical protein